MKPFVRDDLRNMSSTEKASWHARRAEELVEGANAKYADDSTFEETIEVFVAAQTHAQIAQAWASLVSALR